MEMEILHYIQGFHQVLLDKIMVGISYTGNYGAIWILIALGFILSKRYRVCGIAMVVALLFSHLIGNVILKHLIQRQRPSWIDSNIVLLIKNPKDFSFPSGHTLSSFSSAVTIFLYNRKAGIAAILWASLIGFSRLYLFVHYPSDVISSIILGTGIAFLATFIINKQIIGLKSDNAKDTEKNL